MAYKIVVFNIRSNPPSEAVKTHFKMHSTNARMVFKKCLNNIKIF